ncbi:MAG TPA: YXWGXW repeat-containing protein [Verrucomicrobiae bacterium]|nr:YXWGXW repeat-containing protein [Verrucomicrobiae bacterium]
MKIAFVNLVSVIAAGTLLTACTSPNGQPDYTGSGALIGGASGAAIGAVADRGAPGIGALIGGAAGLIAGGLVGHSMDEQRAASAPPPGYVASQVVLPPSIDDIKRMSHAGVGDDVIIAQINNSHAVYDLDTSAIIDLNSAGVSQKVISYMLNTANVVVAQAPPPPQPETVVVAPGPDYVWVGGEWVWSGGGWVWIGGRWAYPPHRHAFWVEARWERGPRGWHREPGHWR